MNVASFCQRDLVTVAENASLSEAAGLMRSRHVGALVVTSVDGDQQFVTGIVTDRDLVVEVLARNLAAAEMKVGQVTNRKLVAVPGSAGIGEAVKAMNEAGVRRLLVTEGDGRLSGLVSSDDLLYALAAELGGLASALRAGIAREGRERQGVVAPTPRPVFLPEGTPGWQRHLG